VREAGCSWQAEEEAGRWISRQRLIRFKYLIKHIVHADQVRFCTPISRSIPCHSQRDSWNEIAAEINGKRPLTFQPACVFRGLKKGGGPYDHDGQGVFHNDAPPRV
jgi:hypothetical protein